MSGDNFVKYVLSFFMWVPETDSSGHVCVASALPTEPPHILSFGYCYSYIVPVLLVSQANSYVYKDYFPNPNIKASTKNAVQPCPKKPTFKNTSFISKNRC